MPSQNDLISDFDDFQETEPHPAVSKDTETLPVAVPSKKSKKKGKKHAARAKLEDDEDTPYPKSVTPSPPADYGVKLDPPSPPREPETLLDEPIESAPLAWDRDATAIEEPKPEHEPEHEHEPEQPTPRAPPAPSPAVRSPRPAPAKPISPNVSPRFQPASLHGAPQHYGFLRGSLPASSVARRESFGVQRSPQTRHMDPPPPHMPQSHFFGAPDMGLNLAPRLEHGKTAGSDGYCCRFDSFVDAGDDASGRKARDALLVGSECGLDVYRVLPDKLEVVGRLEGLRGAVIDAKVLPHTERHDDMQDARPLVAVIVHGPTAEDATYDGQEGDRLALYQTTVEVYSLQTQQHITTLYRSTTVRIEQPVVGHLSLPPKPVGNLSLDAKGAFMTLASGSSGEVYVFANGTLAGTSSSTFRCIGKFWTSLQTRLDASRPATANDNAASEAEKQRMPLISLSARWLAIISPYTTAGISIQGSPAFSPHNPSPVGTNTHIAPAQPAITCEIAGMDEEGTLGWLSRKAAQGLVMASQKGYEYGVQGWRELTNPSPPSQQQSHQRSSSQDPDMFPPTNAPADDPRRLAKEPAVVSIIDLQKLLNADEQKLKQAPAPLATFALEEGCNHLSFSPDGLSMLTTNRKGEVSTIWDLSHVAHGRSKLTSEENAEMECGPHVRQLHRIPRNSPSIIVDSVWSRDGDSIAMLTTNGTVHLHEVTLKATSRKRKRRSTTTPRAAEKAEPTVSLSQGVSPPSNGFMSGFRSWSQNVGTQVNALRSQSNFTTTWDGIRETAAAARTAGQRVVSRGLSQGFIAAKSGASDMWHAEDNKIRVKAFPEHARAGCMRWMQRQSGHSLAIVCNGTVQLHPVQRVTRQKGDSVVSGLQRDKHHKAFPLPPISTSRDGRTGKQAPCAELGPHGFWGLRYAPHDQTNGIRKPSHTMPAATVANEVETNPPYCPFHIDARVNIYAFDESANGSNSDAYGGHVNEAAFDFKTRGHGYLENEEPWVFGEPLPAATKMNEHVTDDFDATSVPFDEQDDLSGQIESKLTIQSSGDGVGEQIRVDSRRSRRSGGRSRMDEESGFDVVDGDDGSMM